MTKIYNQVNQKDKRKELRKAITPAEGILWSRIRNSKLGYKFRRQFSIGRYVADFYCSRVKLAVEVDGGQHYEDMGIKNDLERTRYFNDLGITVVRYANLDVRHRLNSILYDLLNQCKSLENKKAV